VERRAGITGRPWIGVHGALEEVARTRFPNGEMPLPPLISFNGKSWRIHGEILSLSIAYPDRTLTPIFLKVTLFNRRTRWNMLFKLFAAALRTGSLGRYSSSSERARSH
jgi:hypothetical protein